MSSPKRADLVVPYKHQPAKPRSEASSMISQTLPMAAMFMRNKLMSWSAVFLALQTFLTEPLNKPVGKDSGSQPPLLRLAFAVLSLATCYLEYFFPATSPTLKKAALTASSTASSVIAEATSTA
ncbi:hypothetical protein JCM33374_g6339 [Metschnikowia sp. JCM 33374]|nr:hypothetical protein JCM33374_g6339 [Metschnikowia sp. JCM 33374]